MLSGPVAIEDAEPRDLLVVGHPRPRAGAGAAGVRRRARPGPGLHGQPRQEQRRQPPDRRVPGGAQGDLGLPRPIGCSARRRSRAASAAWWPSPTPAARSTSRPASFDFDIRPTKDGPSSGDRGSAAATT
jgi:hypothetical protein